jgi:hypothetical protein
MRLHLAAALIGAAVLITAAAAPAQTTTAPTAMPVIGPTAAPTSLATSMPMGGMPSARPGAMPVPAMSLALDARALLGTRTRTGYRLTGQAEVRDACTDAKFQRFLGDIFPPLFSVVQYRRPGTANLLCIQRLTWVTIVPMNVRSAAPPRYVNVRTAKGTTRVPIRSGPVY